MGTLQEAGNAIGEAMRDLDEAAADNGDPLIIDKCRVLHDLLSQGAVDHLVPLGLDWHEAAGVGEARGGGTDKTPPPPTA